MSYLAVRLRRVPVDLVFADGHVRNNFSQFAYADLYTTSEVDRFAPVILLGRVQNIFYCVLNVQEPRVGSPVSHAVMLSPACSRRFFRHGQKRDADLVDVLQARRIAVFAGTGQTGVNLQDSYD